MQAEHSLQDKEEEEAKAAKERQKRAEAAKAREQRWWSQKAKEADERWHGTWSQSSWEKPYAKNGPPPLQARNGPDYLRYYEVLGLRSTCLAEDVSRAFKDLSKLYHPDKLGIKKTGALRNAHIELFKRVVRAHEVLSSKDERAVYDDECCLPYGWEMAASRQAYKLKSETHEQVQHPDKGRVWSAGCLCLVCRKPFCESIGACERESVFPSPDSTDGPSSCWLASGCMAKLSPGVDELAVAVFARVGLPPPWWLTF